MYNDSSVILLLYYMLDTELSILPQGRINSALISDTYGSLRLGVLRCYQFKDLIQLP